MRARGLGSPDRADAVLGAMVRARTGGANFSRVDVPEHNEFRIASTWLRRQILV